MKIFFFMYILCAVVDCFGQKQLTDAETQDFFRLIRQTKEYKELKIKADSINNKGKDQVQQEINIYMVKREQGAPDDYIFSAALERTVLGAALERYIVEYDKPKKQLVSIKKQQTHLQIH